MACRPGRLCRPARPAPSRTGAHGRVSPFFAYAKNAPGLVAILCSNVVATRHLFRYNQPMRDSTKGPRGISLFIVIFNFIAV